MAVQRFTFPLRMRLARGKQFLDVYAAKVRSSQGPLLIYALANELPHFRLGLSASRSVGTAVRRNKIKRLLREAFRLLQNELRISSGGASYDLVVNVRPHQPLSLDEYQALLRKAVKALHSTWKKKNKSADSA